MESTAIFGLAMARFNGWLAPAILVVAVLVMRVLWRRRLRAVLVLRPVCAFAGVMVASVGGALHLPVVTLVAPAGVEDRLRHLQALREGGLVSEAEYQAKRRDILAGR